MKKSEQTYKIEFNHQEMKVINFCNIVDLLLVEHSKLVIEQYECKNNFSKKRIGYCQSAISSLIRNFERLEKEFTNQVEEVA